MGGLLPSWARVGAKVVCISDSWRLAGTDEVTRVPMFGEVLVISDVGDMPGGAALQFVEVPQVVAGVRRTIDVWWDIVCFRPLVTIEDDIAEHFAHHLTTRQPVGA